MSTVDSTCAIEFQWYIWRFFGLDPPEGDTFWARHYTAYGIVFNIFANIWVPLSLYMKCLLSTSLSEFCEAFYLVPVVVVEQLKFINAWRVRLRLKQTHVILRRLDARLQTEEEQNIIQNHINGSKRMFLWLLRLFLVILGSAAFFVICSTDQELAFPAWYPWDWKVSRGVFLVTVIFQLVSLHILAIMTLNNDTYPASYLTIVSGHYKALSCRISLLGDSNTSQDRAYSLLVDCIKDHKIILELVDTMTDLLSFACFYQFSCTAISLCTLTFYVLYVKLSFSKLLHLFFICLGIISETFIVCYAAEEVLHESQFMSQAIFRCNWYSQSQKFQKDLILMLKRSQRPITIMAANVMPVRMASLVAVIKGAYSMFTLLNEITS